MRKLTWILAASGLATGGALLLTRFSTAERNARAAWSELALEGEGGTFAPEMVEELPPPARRFLLHAIGPGTPLARSVTLTMRGEILLDPERAPLDMHAVQILAPPHGFVWRATASAGLMRIQGFDLFHRHRGEMRWLLYGVMPVVRATGVDIDRSAAGRLAMESIMMPAALLPGRGAAWEAVDDSRARFRMTVGREAVVTTLEVDPEGRPLRASAQRWSGDAPGGAGYETFAVEMEGELSSGGYTLPHRLTAGWRLGEVNEFRFFDATLEEALFR